MKLKEIKYPNTIGSLLKAEGESITRNVLFVADHEAYTSLHWEALNNRKQDVKAYNAARKAWVDLNLKYAAPFLGLIEDEAERKEATKKFSKYVRPGANYISGLYEIFE